MCPKCGSQFLKIKKREGIERLMIYMTGKRKYWCRDCFALFRATDRRKKSRDAVIPQHDLVTFSPHRID